MILGKVVSSRIRNNDYQGSFGDFISAPCCSVEIGQYALMVVITLEWPMFCENALNASRLGYAVSAHFTNVLRKACGVNGGKSARVKASLITVRIVLAFFYGSRFKPTT